MWLTSFFFFVNWRPMMMMIVLCSGSNVTEEGAIVKAGVFLCWHEVHLLRIFVMLSQ